MSSDRYLEGPVKGLGQIKGMLLRGEVGIGDGNDRDAFTSEMVEIVEMLSSH